MSLSEDIRNEVRDIFRSAWNTRDGQKVPEDADLKLTNDGVNLDAAVLYADLAESTKLVTAYELTFAAEVYKAYLKSACRIIRSNGGTITAFDGDRVMSVFIGESKNSDAARTALQITGAVKAVNEEIKDFYRSTDYEIRQAIGIDAGQLLVAKTGIRGSNDLVWVGRAANRAAKLCSLREGNFTSWITADVYDRLNENSKLGRGTDMWTRRYWTDYQINVYASNWSWEP